MRKHIENGQAGRFSAICFNILAAVIICLAVRVIAYADEAYVRPESPPLAHSISTEHIDKVIDEAPPYATVTVPASYAKQLPERRRIATNLLAIAAVEYLKPVIDDSRANIPELENLTDEQVALLYIRQMKKDADMLRKYAPSNTMEYLIGAGMRQDMETKNEKTTAENQGMDQGPHPRSR